MALFQSPQQVARRALLCSKIAVVERGIRGDFQRSAAMTPARFSPEAKKSWLIPNPGRVSADLLELLGKRLGVEVARYSSVERRRRNSQNIGVIEPGCSAALPTSLTVGAGLAAFPVNQVLSHRAYLATAFGIALPRAARAAWRRTITRRNTGPWRFRARQASG